MSKYIRILIVDDEKASRESMKMLLNQEGYATSMAESAEEAAAAAQDEAQAEPDKPEEQLTEE